MAGIAQSRAELFEEANSPFAGGRVPSNQDYQDLGASHFNLVDDAIDVLGADAVTEAFWQANYGDYADLPETGDGRKTLAGLVNALQAQLVQYLADTGLLSDRLADGTDPALGTALLTHRPRNSAGAFLSGSVALSVAGMFQQRINAATFGLDPSASAATNTAALHTWASHIASNSMAVIPPGTYQIDTTSGPVGFAKSNVLIFAFGAQFVQNGTNAIAFDLNNGATPEDTGNTNNVVWAGGRFTSSTSGLSGNTNTAIRYRGITRGAIEHVFGAEQGAAFIAWNPIDGVVINKCHGFNNGRHIHIQQYQTVNANPQSIQIEKCGFSIHHVAGLLVEGIANQLTLRDTYFLGKDSVVIESGTPVGFGNFNGESVLIDACTFEQGTTGQFYIRFPNTNSRTMHNVIIRDCGFQDGATKCIQLVNVDTAHIKENRFVSAEAGFIDLGAGCKNINFGANEFQSFASWAQGLAFACARREIHFDNSMQIRDPQQLTGWNFSGISTGTGTLDMSSLIGSTWTSEPNNKFCPPSAWILNIRLEETGSAPGLGMVFKKDAAASSTLSTRCLLDNVAANDERNFNVIVHADDAGDIYYEAVASGANTLKAQIALVGWMR